MKCALTKWLVYYTTNNEILSSPSPGGMKTSNDLWICNLQNCVRFCHLPPDDDDENPTIAE